MAPAGMIPSSVHTQSESIQNLILLVRTVLPMFITAVMLE